MTIKAVSFDLDDTLWPILPVILKAEKGTNEWLIENYPGVEKLLNSKEMMDIRDNLISQKSDLINQLSKLRELSLVELGIRSGYEREEAEIMARESFKIFFSKNCSFFSSFSFFESKIKLGCWPPFNSK